MNEIDEMDMLGYLKLRAFNAKENKGDKNDGPPKHTTIDNIPGLGGSI
ncbi:MAG: hypothetical protein J6Y20_07095 [Lachnospiraceae bacterium]|nr:hypothetical protein [Lachnospiraceae bacterium]